MADNETQSAGEVVENGAAETPSEAEFIESVKAGLEPTSPPEEAAAPEPKSVPETVAVPEATTIPQTKPVPKAKPAAKKKKKATTKAAAKASPSKTAIRKIHVGEAAKVAPAKTAPAKPAGKPAKAGKATTAIRKIHPGDAAKVATPKTATPKAVPAKKTAAKVKTVETSKAKVTKAPKVAKVKAAKPQKGKQDKPKQDKPKAGAKLGKAKSEKAETAKILDSKVVYEGKLFRVLQDHIIEPGGRESRRDVIRHNGSVVILAVDPGKKKKDPWVVIERQYRHAAGQYLWELPAGKLDAGESALEGAKRELAEETGYSAKKWTPLVEYYASPGFLGEAMKVFLAEGLVAGEAHPEEDEHIDFRLVKLSEVLELIDKGKIIDGKTLTSILIYARKHKVRIKK